jgi:type I restriction enzyme, R subunit
VAKSYYDDQFGSAGLSVPEAEAAALAAVVDDIIRAKRKVDWADDVDVQNQMKIAIEDELFAFKKAHGVQLDFDTIDRLLDRIIDVARRRVP